MKPGINNVFDLGISYNKKIVQRLFNYYYTRNMPEEITQLLNECRAQNTKEEGMDIIWDFCKWGSGRANEFVGIVFGYDGKLKLLIGYCYHKSRYTPKAVAEICKKVILIILALQKHGVI